MWTFDELAVTMDMDGSAQLTLVRSREISLALRTTVSHALRSAFDCVARGVGTVALAIAASTAHAAGWPSFAGNAQHTGISTTPAQALARIRWSTPVDLAPPPEPILIHYGSPVITPGNTVIIPVKTGVDDGFRLDARRGGDGTLLWSAGTRYVQPPHGFVISYSPTLAAGGRVWFAGPGGTLYFRDNLDTATPVSSGQAAFYGLAAYQAASASFDSTVFINTPITADNAGNLYFGFRATAGAPLGLVSGIARVNAAGVGTWIAASAAAGDPAVTIVPHQAAPALSADESTLYVVVANDTANAVSLVGLDPSTLAVRESSPGVKVRVLLKDPRDAINNAPISEFSSASPMVGPDGDVYYGVFANPDNGSRGWLLHYSANLVQTKTPGAFGWDTTPSVVPAAAVPSYAGTSPYLIFSKYNDYAGYDGSSGINKIAVLDPNATMTEPHPSSNGTLVMREILTIAGPTPDPEVIAQYPDAVKEWCINTAAVDPATRSIMVNSEDGKLYRWDLVTNTLSQSVVLSAGIGEAYTSTLIGPDGTVYATNQAILNAVGSTVTVTVTRKGSGSGSVSSTAAGIGCGLTCSAQFAAGQPVTLSALAAPGSVFAGWLGACTGRGSCSLTPMADTAVSATFAPASALPIGADVDGNGTHDALTDGLLAIRYLFGLTGTALTVGAIGSGAVRTDPVQLINHLNDVRPVFDIDGNGQVDALTDGLMLLRYLFGLRGAALTGGVIAPNAIRTSSSAIEAYLQTLTL